MKKNLVSLFLIVTVIIYIFTYFCTNPGFASQKTGNLGKSQSEAAGIEAAKSIKETQAYVENLLKEIADLTKKMQKAEADKNMPLLRTLADSLAQKLTDHANILLAGGHLNSAGAKYFSAVQLDQNNYRALSGLGYVLLQQGMFEQAAITLAKAIQAYPEKLNKNDKTSNYMAHNNLGICYIELARRDIDVKQKLLYSKASRTLKQAIKIDENHHFAYFNLARVYEGRKAYSMAVDNYVAAINKNPKDNEAYIAAARLYKDELKKSDKAMQIIEKAVKNVPNASAIHSFKADLLMDKKAITEAYFNYWTEFFKNPATPWAQHSLEKIKSLMVSEYKKIDSKDPLHLFMKAYKYFQEQDYDKAVDFYDKALKKDPDNFMIMLMLADTLKYQKEYKKAIDIYIQAIKASNKKFAFLYYELANTLMKIKQYDRAAELLTDALILDPYNMQYYINKGVCLMEKENYQEAINVLYAGCTRFPDSTFGHYNLGKALFHNKQIFLAKQEFEYIMNKKTGDEIKKAAKSYLARIDEILKKAEAQKDKKKK